MFEGKGKGGVAGWGMEGRWDGRCGRRDGRGRVREIRCWSRRKRL